jgi:CRISPR-associated protein Csb2
MRTAALIQTALQRAGIETPCEFTWQSVPFFKNCLSAHKYARDGRQIDYHRPKHLRTQTAIHLRVTFTEPVPGPLTIGAGRHCGFGLIACVPDSAD